MSSSVRFKDRIQRGKTTSIQDLPPKIQELVIELKEKFGGVGLYGSYWKGYWAEDSDIDILVSDRPRNELEVRRIVNEKYGMRCCVGDIDKYPEGFFVRL